MKPQSKLIITEYRDKIVSVLTEDSRPVQISLESKEQESILGNIYIGRVQNIVKNINAAFVEIAPGITGYYSLTENRRHWLGDKPEERTLRIGDEIMVQVEKDGIKTKAPMLTSNISLAGKYCVLTVLFPNISFSGKIRSSQWKETVKGLIEARKQPSYGVIVRTNARDAGHEEILQELNRLSGEFEKILAQRAFRACYSLLCEASPPFLREIRNVYTDTLTAIVTDKQELYDEIFRYLSFNQPEDLDKLTFYEDSLLSLSSLYSLETVIGEALQPRVWLKSGGYLVIEPTEALTVIDVNTGKFSGHKNPQDTLMKINLEAARAVARELRLRNLSGIIVVDFIDMESEENRKLLMETLRSAVRKDPVKTTVVDMTKLGLIEITRKKVRPSLYQQAR
ncbi:MAG: ribonuclease E/G [Lachnospiraceae bacterium]|nr:ribonuclease E/G [Lachnospiraceae bacterium]